MRTAAIEAIEKRRGSKVIVYYTGERPRMEAQIGKDVVDLFVEHLDAIWPAKKISLFLYTRGGDASAAWRLANLLHTFCDDLEVIVPSNSLSAGTLICLGANRIVMTKQAALGPIDPSLNHPMNPLVTGSNQRTSVSVEAVQGYLDLVRQTLGIKDQGSLERVVTDLSDKIHPLVLGQIFRSRAQIRKLADRLLQKHGIKADQREQIISFLCSESGSHDHTINRREAKELGLTVEVPNDDFYKEIKTLHQEVLSLMEMHVPFSPEALLGQEQEVEYCVTRSLVESAAAKSHQFLSKGILKRVTEPEEGVQDRKSFEGWKKVDDDANR